MEGRRLQRHHRHDPNPAQLLVQSRPQAENRQALQVSRIPAGSHRDSHLRLGGRKDPHPQRLARTLRHDASITKWDIFHYIYAVLHHPEYRERYAANLRRELPRIPFATSTPCHPEAAESSAKPRTPNEGPMQLAGSAAAADKSIGPSARKERGPQDDKDVFKTFVAAGKRLAEIHVHYEQQPEFKLTKVEKKGERLDYRVTKMKLSKDKSTLIYNQFLTLSAIPKQTYDYHLGNRSALDWVIDQCQVSTDRRSGITNDPNRADDPQYILRLIGQVITVSLETVAIVSGLPPLGLPQ